MMPIVLDLEFTDFDFNKGGVWQIGAIDLENIENSFLEEARIDDEDETIEDALKVVEKKEKELRDPKKQSQKQLLEKFFKWAENIKLRNLLAQNIQWDFGFLITKSKKYGLKFPFHHRCFDLHSVAQTKFVEINKKISIEKNHSDMKMGKILKFCGLKDERLEIRNGEIIQEGKPHNALEDCKLTGECFSRLMFGKNLFPEYSKFPIPGVLKK